MSTRINISVDSDGLLERNRQQVDANRLSFLTDVAREDAAQEGVDRRNQDLIAAGIDPETRRPLDTSAIDPRPNFEEPGAYRRGILVSLTPTAASGPVEQFDGPISTRWFTDFGTLEPVSAPRRWWIPNRQTGFSPRIAFAEPSVQLDLTNTYPLDYLKRVGAELRGDNEQVAARLAEQTSAERLTVLAGYISAGPIDVKARPIKRIEFGARLYLPNPEDPEGWRVIYTNLIKFIVTGSIRDSVSSEPPIEKSSVKLVTRTSTQRNSPLTDLPTFQRSTDAVFGYGRFVAGPSSPTVFEDIPRDEWLDIKVVLTKTSADPFEGIILIKVGEQSVKLPLFLDAGISTVDPAVNLARARDLFESTLFDLTIEPAISVRYIAALLDPSTNEVIATFDPPAIPPSWRAQNMYLKIT